MRSMTVGSGGSLGRRKSEKQNVSRGPPAGG